MSRFKRKFKWKNILSFVLVGVLLVGAVAGLGSVFGKDTKTISPTAFAVGAIDDNGNFEKSDVSIYTKDMFECQGLSIEPDFEATGTYKVFYYDESKNFIGATDLMNAEDGVYNRDATFPVAKYCRIMITPDVPTDDDGKEVKDFKIRFYEVASYANEYTITVNKKQNFDSANLWEVDTTMNGKYWCVNEDTAKTLKQEPLTGYTSSKLINVSEFEKISVYIPVASAGTSFMSIFMEDADTYISFATNSTNYTVDSGYAVYEFVVPDGAMYFIAGALLDYADSVILIGE